MNFIKQHFNKKALTFSFLLLLFAEFTYNISSYVVKFGLGRILTKAEFGRFSLITSLVTFLTLLISKGGIPSAMMKRISEHKDDLALIHSIKKLSAKLQFLIVFVVTLIFYLSSSFLANFFNDPTLTPLFQLNALVIPAFALSSFHVSYFNGLKRFGAMTSMKISRGVFRITWIVGLAYFFGLKGAFLGSILAPFSVFLDAVIIEKFVFKDNEKIKDLPEKKYNWKMLTNYAQASIFFTLFYELFTRTDLYLIKIFLKNDDLMGDYSAAMEISLIPNYLFLALTLILFPTISNHKTSGDYEKIKKLIKRVVFILFLILVPMSLILPFFSKFLTHLSFGEKYTNSVALIPLMMGGTIFLTIFNVLASIWNGAGYIKITAILSFLAIILSSVLNYFFIFHYGIKATAIIFSISSTFIGLTLLILTYFKFFKKEKN